MAASTARGLSPREGQLLSHFPPPEAVVRTKGRSAITENSVIAVVTQCPDADWCSVL